MENLKNTATSSIIKQRWKVTWSKQVQTQLTKIPHYISGKFYLWAMQVEENGMINIRQRTGYHDEQLRGARSGQRSVRLNKAYRAIYIEKRDGEFMIAEVIEVNKHDY